MLKMISVSLVLILGFSFSSYGANVPSGRKLVDIGQYPYLGVLWMIKPKSSPMICTSVLVTYKCAITAGQCLVINTPTKNYSLISLQEYNPHVIMGVSTYTDTKNPTYQKSKVVKLLQHQKTNFSGGTGPFPIRYDIGAVIVDPKMRSSPKVGTVRLISEHLNPDKVFTETSENHTTCFVVGWRATAITRKFNDQATGPEFLLSSNVTIMDVEKCCNDFYNFHGVQQYQHCLDSLKGAGHACVDRASVRDGKVDFESTSSPVICPVVGKHYVFGTVTYGWTTPIGTSPVMLRPLMVDEKVLRAYVEMLIKTEHGRGSAAVQSDRILLLLIIFYCLIKYVPKEL